MSTETIQADQPAFPTIGDITHNPSLSTEHGMTLRQYYAGRAMQGLIQGFIPIESKYSVNNGYMALEEMAADAVKAADFLIAELSKPIKP